MKSILIRILTGSQSNSLRAGVTYNTGGGILNPLQNVNEYEKRRVTLLLPLDLSAVFDAVDRTVLLQRL